MCGCRVVGGCCMPNHCRLQQKILRNFCAPDTYHRGMQHPPTTRQPHNMASTCTRRSMTADLLIEQHALQQQHPITCPQLHVMKQHRSTGKTTIARTSSTKHLRHCLTIIGNRRAPTGTAQCHHPVHSRVTVKLCPYEFIPHTMHSHTVML